MVMEFTIEVYQWVLLEVEEFDSSRPTIFMRGFCNHLSFFIPYRFEVVWMDLKFQFSIIPKYLETNQAI